MRAIGDHTSLLQHNDAIRPAYLRQSMGDQNGRSSLLGAAHCLLDFVFGRAVNGAG